MPGKPKTDLTPAALRRRAEKLANKLAAAHADADIQRLLHELEVHQIELEMQNTELRRARDESEALLEKYTELYDFAPVGYFTLSADGTIRLANLTGASMVGSERSNLMGRSFGIFLAHTQRVGFKTFLKQVFAAETKQSGEFELADEKLGIRIVSVVAQHHSNGLECSTMVKDITTNRLAQEQIRVSENRYRRLFEAAHDGVLLVDPATNRIVDANPFITRLLKYSREQLVGRELFEIGLLKDEVVSRKMFRELKKSHEVRYENLPMKSRMGRHKDVEVVANLYQEDGQPMIQLNIRDITERKLAEAIARRNLSLEQAIVRKEKIEENLRVQRDEQSRVLKLARAQQKQLRDLSHRILNAQEEERKRISRELHDVIAQTLVGINVHLAVLNKGSATPPATFRRQLAKTQKLVTKAVGIVHDFARQLRPTMLDDLGLIPTLQMFMERFMADTGIRASLKTSAKVNESATMALTVLYRIAQEALTNVARHSKASRVDITIVSLEKTIRMAITDDGQGFQVIGKSGSRKKSRLGLIGMRERAEMIGGSLLVDSKPGGPTTVTVEIPVS